ncbi:MAG: enoyl-CoA hydratase/isomerase family protein [Phycisphaerales bacterium]
MSELATLQTAGPVARLTINRPEQRNALSLDLLDALHAQVDHIAADPSIHVVVLTGAGRAFCAGMDLKQVLGNADTSSQLLHRLGDLTFKLRALPAVTLAVVNGPAIGGGCGLVTVCDLSISFVDNKMGFPEVDLGVCPAVVAPWLVRKVGPGMARYILLSGGLMSGKEAFDRGILTQLVPTATDLEPGAEQLITRLSTGAPAALRATKSLLNELDGSTDRAILDRAASLSAEVLNTPATQAMLKRKLGA